MHVAVLKGGFSAEREVSLKSGAAVAVACRALGHRVTEIDVAADVVTQLQAAQPDVAFNALHGQFGEDGGMQGILELLRIPYTHSGVLASAVAMDKPMAKVVFAAAGLRVAQGMVVAKEALFGQDPMPRPYVVKPANEGSSVGVKLMFDNSSPNRNDAGRGADSMQGLAQPSPHPNPPPMGEGIQRSESTQDHFFFTPENWPYGETVLVEKYIAGRELTAAVLDDVCLGVTEITIPQGFYDYENKYTAGGSVHICPAQLPQTVYDAVMQMALTAHRALGCRGLSRSDFRWDEAGDGQLYILETNTQPGMTPLSLSPELAAYAGIDFNALVQRLIDGARCG